MSQPDKSDAQQIAHERLIHDVTRANPHATVTQILREVERIENTLAASPVASSRTEHST